MKYLKILPVFMLFFGAWACIKDTIQLEDISGDMAYEREISIPVIKGSLTFDDIAGHGYDSLVILQSGDTIFIYLNNDLGFNDTIAIGEQGENMDFDFINVHYKITNMFPVGLDLRMYLHDSVTNQNMDTIWFSGTPGEIFIKPAPSDINGLTVEDSISTSNSFVALTENFIDDFFNAATHLIVVAEIPSTGGIVKILRNYRLYMQLGIEARGRYVIYQDSIH
jgi:hypothetical protein